VAGPLGRTFNRQGGRTYDMHRFVNGSKTASPDFFHLGEASKTVGLSRTSWSRRLRSRGIHGARKSPAQANQAAVRLPASTTFSAIGVVVDKSYP
jgi:hypothetical protein